MWLMIINQKNQMTTLLRLYALGYGILITSAGSTFTSSQNSQAQDLAEGTSLVFDTLRLPIEKPEEISATKDFETDEFYLADDPCRCSANDLRQLLAPFNGPGLSFLPAYRGSQAQAITLVDHVAERDACRLAGGTSACKKAKFKLLDKKTHVEITNFPYRGLFQNGSTLTFQPQDDSPVGLHEVLLAAYLHSQNNVFQTVVIKYHVSPSPEHTYESKPSDQTYQEQLQHNQGKSRLLMMGEPPTQPLSLANREAITDAGIVGLTWAAPALGGPVTFYEVSAKSAPNNPYVVLSDSIPASEQSYTASDLISGTVYTFRVRANSEFGWGDYSSAFDQVAAVKPDKCAAPVTSTQGTNAVITWTAPTDGGATITAYLVKIYCRGTDTWHAETVNCDGSNPSIVSAKTCTIPLTVLKAAPFSIEVLDVIQAECSAINAAGAGPTSNPGSQGVMIGPPEVPGNLDVQVNTNIQVTITWQAFGTGGSPITGYTVAIMKSDQTYNNQCIDITATTCIVTIAALQAAPYNLVWGGSVLATVLAKNIMGSSAPTEPNVAVKITTNPDAPTQLANNAQVTSATAIGITWLAPVGVGGTPITNYIVEWDQGIPNSWVELGWVSAPTTVYTTTQPLIAATLYSFRIKSVNAFGNSLTYSNYVQITPLVTATVPSTPSAPTTAISGSNVSITWTAPADGGSVLTGYIMEIQKSDLTFTTYTGCAGTATTCTIAISVLKAAPYNLLVGSNVSAKIIATNAIGNSEASYESMTLIIPVTVPSTPQAPTTAVSSSNVVITWTAPADGGSVITGYTVQIQQSDLTFIINDSDCTGIATSCTIAISVLKASPCNLVVGSNVSAKIIATNAIGESAVSPVGNGAIIPATVPSTPQAPTTAISSSNVVITWTAPADGGSAITGYSVQIQQSDGTTYTAHTGCIGTVTSCTIAISFLKATPYNLLVGSSVYAKIIATNAIGNSAASLAGNGAIIPATVPSTPQAPTTAISSSNVVITWTAPADGGSAITGYIVQIQQSDGTTYTAHTGCIGIATSCTIAISVLKATPYNLISGSSVFAKIIATNAIGNSAESPAGNGAIIPATVPSTPSAPTTVNSGTNVLINWVAPANGGSAITGYTVLIQQSDLTTYTVYTGCTGTSTSCTIAISVLQAAPYNLSVLSTVFAKVQAVNSIGSSAQSPAGNGAVIITYPAPPSSLVNNSLSAIALTWVAPSDNGGSAIIDYNVFWDQGTGTYVSLAQNIMTTSYDSTTVLTPLLVYNFKVKSRNTFGDSSSSPGVPIFSNIVTIVSLAVVPTAPISLANNAAATASGIVGLTWLAVASDGGSPVIDYQISYKSGAEAYKVLAQGITTTNYTESLLTSDVVYTFKVTARNSIGYGAESTSVNVRAAAKPDVPDAPTTVNSKTGIEITWKAPKNGGSVITGYTVAIKNSKGVLTAEQKNCNVLSTSCTVPISTLQAEPFNLIEGDSIQASVLATNVVGSSSYSVAGKGAVIELSTITKSIEILNMAATIDQWAVLLLPDLGVSYRYFLLSYQTFEVTIDGNKLKVHSTNKQDVGTKFVDLAAYSTSEKRNYTVNIRFTSSVKNSANETLKANTTVNSVVKTENTTQNVTSPPEDLSIASNLADKISQMTCTSDEDGNLKSCEDPKNPKFQCKIDAYGQLVCGLDLKITKNATDAPIPVAPTMEVKKMDGNGEFKLKFDQDMDFSSLIGESADSAARLLKVSGKKGGNQTTYLLSDQHLEVLIEPSGDEDEQKLGFYWYAKKITPREIAIQVVFQNPLYISTNANKGDKLEIRLKPAALAIFKSTKNKQPIKNAFKTQAKKMPTQTIPGPAKDNVQTAGDVLKQVSQWSVIINFILQLVVGGAMARMWTMINSLQMIMTNCLLNVPMPANVFLVMTNLATVSSGEILPSDQILTEIFNFSPTDIQDVGFVAMGVNSARLTMYLGSVFIYMFLLLVQCAVYGIAYALRNHFKVCNRIQNKIRETQFWGGIFRFGLECYLDMNIGIYLSLLQFSYVTGSDFFDIIFTIVCVAIVLGLPIAVVVILCKNPNIEDAQFQVKYGSITEGLRTSEVHVRDTKKMIIWFLIRRFLTGVIVVPLAHQTIWIQLAPNIMLTLADACITFHLNPYENKIGGYMAMFNDAIVLFLSYFPFLFTNMLPDPETRYSAGWIFITIISLMVIVNLVIVIQGTVVVTVEEARRKTVEQHNYRLLKIRRIEMDIIVMSPLQKVRTYLGIDWLFAEQNEHRLNDQIAQYLPYYEYSSSVFLIDNQSIYQQKADFYLFGQNLDQKDKNLTKIQLQAKKQERLKSVNLEILDITEIMTLNTNQVGLDQSLEQIERLQVQKRKPIVSKNQERTNDFIAKINSQFDEDIQPVTVKKTRFESAQNILRSFDTSMGENSGHKLIDLEIQLIAENLPSEFSEKPQEAQENDVKDLFRLLQQPSAAKVYEKRAIKPQTSADKIKTDDKIEQLINEELEIQKSEEKITTTNFDFKQGDLIYQEIEMMQLNLDKFIELIEKE